MTWLAPVFLAAGAAAAIAITLLHFLARRRPRDIVLPTARFLPERSTEATAHAPRPTDLLLLALRVLVVLLASAAFARPVLRRSRRAIARVVVADVSRAPRSVTEVADSVRPLLAPDDVLITFDSAARVRRIASADSISRSPASGALGSLSAALVAARRAAVALRAHADSIELVIVSPLSSEEIDAATAAIRAEWSGRARVIRVAPASSDSATHPVNAAGAHDDGLRTLFALAGPSAADVRVMRGHASAADSLWLRGATGRVLVDWPSATAGHDTVGAVIAGDAVVVATLSRVSIPPVGTVIARWVDGTPAATETSQGSGCLRHVSVALAAGGDLILRESVRRFARAMVAPCGRTADLPVGLAGDSTLAVLRGAGPLALANAFGQPDTDAVSAWLIGAALVLVLIELIVRSRRIS